ncbi:MAG: DUF1176 domain-containing protein [Devosiaceae bacterium]|nr:DUF1176 domain-containing protein [Devosiaceae bacterium]
MKQFKTIATPFALALLLQMPNGAVAQKAVVNTTESVQQIFETLYAGNCSSLIPGNSPSTPKIYQMTFNYGDEDFPPRPYQLYEYLCFDGPYNQGFVYFGVDDIYEITNLSFAIPTFETTYENNDSYGAVTNIEVTGFSASNQIFNANFFPETKTMYSYNKWRGPADAFTVGQWRFIEGQFVLQTYDVDAAFDGKRKAERIYGPGEAPNYD